MPPICSLVSVYGPSVTITFPACEAQCFGAVRGLKRFASRKMPVFTQHVVVREAAVHQRIAVVLGHVLELTRFDVTKAYEFHDFSFTVLPRWHQVQDPSSL